MILRKDLVADENAAARALVELFSAAGLSDRVDRETELAPPSEGEAPLHPLDWLVLASAEQDLPLDTIEAGLEESSEWLRRGVPLLTALETTGPAGVRWAWVVLHAEDDGHLVAAVHTADGREELRLPLEQLAKELDLEPTQRIRWVLTGHTLVPPVAADASSPGKPLHPLRRLLMLVRPDRGDLLAVAMFAVVIGFLLLATPVAVQAVVNFVALGGAIPPLIVVVGFLFLGLALANFLSAFQTWAVEILQRRIFVRTVADLSMRLPRVSLSEASDDYGPELVNRFFDLETIQKRGSFLLLDGLSLLLSVLVGLVLLAFYHPLLLAFDILILGAIVLVVLGPIRKGIATAKAESNAKFAMAAWLEEIARNPSLFKTSGVLKSVFERSDRLAREYVESRARHFRIAFGQGVAALLLQIVASTALLGIGAFLVISGSLTLGQLVAAELVLALVLSSVAKLGKHLEAFYDLMAATDKVGKLLDLPMERSSGEHHFETGSAPGAALELRSVGWAPPQGSALFRDATLEAAPGERIGVRGPSGSGKTSLLQLVWGLRTPSEGAVSIDGRDVRDLSFESLRRSVGLIDGVDVIDDTVRANVGLGRPFVSDEDVRESLRRVELLDELSGLPGGVETRLRMDGRPLSFGQLVRLQVARATACAPRLLLVSDLFGDLDPEERNSVLDVLCAPDAPWTLVLATNDPEALARCNRTYLLENGTLREESGVPA